MTTFEKVKKIFVEDFEIRADIITPEMMLESIGLDSLDRIEFIFALEDKFKIKIPEREVRITTVQDIVDIVDKLAAGQQGISHTEGETR